MLHPTWQPSTAVGARLMRRRSEALWWRDDRCSGGPGNYVLGSFLASELVVRGALGVDGVDAFVLPLKALLAGGLTVAPDAE